MHSSSLLPIIIMMKIWSRIGADQGNEQSGPQPPERYCSADTKARAGDFLRRGAVRRRSAAVDCARFRAAEQRYPLVNTRSTAHVAYSRKFQVGPTGQKTSSTPKKRRENPQISGISNRFWPKNRSYRKQTIKPCLTGARMHIKDFDFLALFASEFPAGNLRSRLKTDRIFQSCRTTSTRFWSKSRTCRKQTLKPFLAGAATAHFASRTLRRDVQISDESNRNWRANRSYRKQTTRPLLTETRIALCNFGFLALFDAVRNREQRRFSATDVRPSLRWTCVTLPGETATNGLH